MPAEAPARPTSAELRERCLEAGDRLRDLRSIPAERRPDSWAADARSAADELHDLDRQFTAAQHIEAYDLQRAAFDAAVAQAEAEAADPSRRGSRGPDAAFDGGDPEVRTAGQDFTEADFYRSMENGQVRYGEVETRNLLTGSSIGTSGSHAFAPVGSPTWNSAAARRMQFFLRDLIPVVSTGLQSVPYIRELSALANEGGASAVSEASAKPEVTQQFETDDAPIRKIAAWIQVTEEAYADAPTLRGYVDTRLAYMLQVREEALLLAGNGTAPNIKGITSFTDVQTQAAINDDLAGTIGLAIGKVENVDGMADGVAINPTTFWTGVVERHSTWMDGQTQTGAAGSGLPFGAVPSTLFGLPTVRTRVLGANKALVGCYQIGATIFERMGTTVKSTDSHASLFISNTLVVLAEKRTGLAVHRPDFFVDTTLAFT